MPSKSCSLNGVLNSYKNNWYIREKLKFVRNTATDLCKVGTERLRMFSSKGRDDYGKDLAMKV